MHEHLVAIAGGRAFNEPVYSFADYARTTATRRIQPTEFLIVEGLFVLYWPELRKMLDEITPDILVELRVRVARFRDQHRHRLAHVASVSHEELECVVEQCGVGTRRVECICEPACSHPVDVALDRVHFTVVAEQTKRLRALPRGCGVRREALMKDSERRSDIRITKVGIKRGELIGCAERLVGHGPKRQRGDVQAMCAVEPAPRPAGTRLGLVGCRSERLS